MRIVAADRHLQRPDRLLPHAPQTVRSPTPGSGCPLQQRTSPQCQSPPAAPRSGHDGSAPAGTGLEDVLVVRKSRVERAKEAAAANAARYEAAAPAKAAPAEPGACGTAGSRRMVLHETGRKAVAGF